MLYYDDIENIKNYIDMAKDSDASALIDKFSVYVGDESFEGKLNIFYKEDELRNFFETKFEIITIENYLEFEKDDSIILIAKKV